MPERSELPMRKKAERLRPRKAPFWFREPFIMGAAAVAAVLIIGQQYIYKPFMTRSAENTQIMASLRKEKIKITQGKEGDVARMVRRHGLGMADLKAYQNIGAIPSGQIPVDRVMETLRNEKFDDEFFRTQGERRMLIPPERQNAQENFSKEGEAERGRRIIDIFNRADSLARKDPQIYITLLKQHLRISPDEIGYQSPDMRRKLIEQRPLLDSLRTLERRGHSLNLPQSTKSKIMAFAKSRSRRSGRMIGNNRRRY
ncbi:MAG: hypothetical protein ABH863_02920 [Candidatus Micrarchaeota archaeon]